MGLWGYLLGIMATKRVLFSRLSWVFPLRSHCSLITMVFAVSLTIPITVLVCAKFHISREPFTIFIAGCAGTRPTD